MTINSSYKEIQEIIDKHYVYGAESIINALVHSCYGKQYLDEEEIIKLVKCAFRREEERC